MACMFIIPLQQLDISGYGADRNYSGHGSNMNEFKENCVINRNSRHARG